MARCRVSVVACLGWFYPSCEQMPMPVPARLTMHVNASRSALPHPCAEESARNSMQVEILPMFLFLQNLQMFGTRQRIRGRSRQR